MLYPPSASTNFQASDHGLLSWTFDPVQVAGNTALATAGTVYVAKMHLANPCSITNIICQVAVAGGTLTTGQCFAGIYQAGSLLGATADMAATWGGTGVKTMALSGGPFAATAGDIYIATFFNGTTGPAFGRAGTGPVNAGLAAASSRFGTADTGRTTSFPGSLGTVAALAVAYWFAVS